MLYRFLRAAARIALRWYYADVVVQGAARVPRTDPLLVIANHPNALVDALLVTTTLQRRVLLTAKATLFGHPLLAPLLRAVGVVPLRRAADERAADHAPAAPPDAARNSDTFRQVRDALARGGAVLVFPEGISHDEPGLAPLKSGAARMALDAAGQGVTGLQLLPLGLVFERKEQPRSRVLVRVGTPIAVDAWCATTPEPTAAALTRALDDGLRAVTLNFASDARAERAVTLARALAAIVELPPALGAPRRLDTEAAIAERIERATQALVTAPSDIARAADRFTARVHLLEQRVARAGATLEDLQVSPRLRHGAWFVVREGALLAVALPVAWLGRVAHWLPLAIARALAMRPLVRDPSRDQPAMRTIVLGLAAVLAWYLAQFALVSRWLGAAAGALWIVAIALAGGVDLELADRVARARRRARTYLALRRAPALRQETLQEMEALLSEAIALEQMLLRLPAG